MSERRISIEKKLTRQAAVCDLVTEVCVAKCEGIMRGGLVRYIKPRDVGVLYGDITTQLVSQKASLSQRIWRY